MERPVPAISAVGRVLLLLLLIAGLFGFSAWSEHANETTRVCTVTGKDRTSNSDGGSDARIYTEECDTLQVADLFWRGQYNSSTIYGEFQVGRTYEVTTVGWRRPPLSMFPRVLGSPTETPGHAAANR